MLGTSITISRQTVRRRVVAILAMVALGAACETARPQQTIPPQEEPASFAGFTQRVGEYAALRGKLAGTLPTLPTQTTDEALRVHQQALRQLIAEARAQSREGDLFDAGIRPTIHRICEGVFKGPDGGDAIAEVREDPSEDEVFRAEVNTRYPDNVPLSWMPHRLLAALPPLPEALRYRFLGDDLILLDEDARVILDVVRGVLPH